MSSFIRMEWPAVREPSEQDSMQSSKNNDETITQSAQLQQALCALEAAEQNMARADNTSDKEKERELSLEDHSDTFCRIMKGDESIIVCLPSEDLASHNAAVQSCPVFIYQGIQTPTCESLIRRNAAEKCTPTSPCTPTCDVMVHCTSAHTRTEAPETADQGVNTELYMSDLDYIAEEFIKLRMSQEFTEPKKKIKSSACSKECAQRAQRAELCLLALQYHMCRQHCWRLYHTFTEGDQLTAITQDPPANIMSVLQNLESEYNQMKHQILRGVPLEQLNPLCVDSENITTGECYTPARVIKDTLGNVSFCASQEPQKLEAAEETGCPADGSTNSYRNNQKMAKHLRKESEEIKRAAALVPSGRGVSHKEKQEKQIMGEELNVSEEWYDAEEGLQHSGPAASAEVRLDSDKTDESVPDETSCSVLHVSNLPSNMTQSDVMQLFEKHQPSRFNFSFEN